MLTENLFLIPKKATTVKRFSGSIMKNHRFSISEHTFEVVYYALQLVEEWKTEVPILESLRGEILENATLHDVPEIYTGDLPFPIKKRYPDSKILFDRIERDYINENLPKFNKEYNFISRFVVKYADTLAVSREIIEEIESSNKDFDIFVENISVIFYSLYNSMIMYGYNENWSKLRKISIQTLIELGLDKYVKISSIS